MNWKVKNLVELTGVATDIIDNFEEDVILFKGDMGAGKTTLIKEICKALKVEDDVSSPTFSIVNEYRGERDVRIFHFDFYRIDNEEEAYDFGYEEYFFSGELCLVEWPEKIRNLLPIKFGLIQIAESDGIREISYEPSSNNLP